MARDSKEARQSLSQVLSEQAKKETMHATMKEKWKDVKTIVIITLSWPLYKCGHL